MKCSVRLIERNCCTRRGGTEIRIEQRNGSGGHSQFEIASPPLEWRRLLRTARARALL